MDPLRFWQLYAHFSDGESVQATALSNYAAGETNFSYQTITGTNLNLGDDDVASITSPFQIEFGGGTFSTLYVGSNGTRKPLLHSILANVMEASTGRIRASLAPAF